MTKIYLSVYFDLENGGADLTEGSKEKLEQFLEGSSITLLDMLNDSVQAFESYYERCYFETFPALRPDSNIIPFPSPRT